MPCSFIQPAGDRRLHVTADGVVAEVPVKINANLRTSTVEELVGQKRSMHLATFRFLVDEVRRDLERLAAECDAESRLRVDVDRSKPEGQGYSVKVILDGIVGQCRTIYKRHEGTSAARIADNDIYRSLVAEMLDCKLHSISKMRWWLEDRRLGVRDLSVSGAKYSTDRADELRDAHRGYIEFLTQSLPAVGAARGAVVRPTGPPLLVARPDTHLWPGVRAAAALKLCKIKGLIRERADEANELGETPLQRAASEGETEQVLRLLVDARADVDARNARRSGATALFLAAQRDDGGMIRALRGLGADLESRANGILTPLMIAASGGSDEAIKALVELRADVNASPVYRQSALRSAVTYGHPGTARLLRELGAVD